MADETNFFSQRDAAREYTRLAHVCGELFAALGAVAPRLEPAAATAAGAQLSRRLGQHAARWAELVPESVLLAPERDDAGSTLTTVQPTLPAVLAGLDDLRVDLETLLTRTSDVADGAARRAARSTVADIDDALRDLRCAVTPAA